MKISIQLVSFNYYYSYKLYNLPILITNNNFILSYDENLREIFC